MKNLSNNLSTFIKLREQSQESSDDGASLYIKPTHITPTDGIIIYIRAIDKITNNINAIIAATDKIHSFRKNFTTTNNQDISMLKATLTEDYLKTVTIIKEFIKGFSITYDPKITELMSVYYKGFSYTMQQLDLGYITNKIAYYKNSLGMLNKLHESFSKMLPNLVAEADDSNLKISLKPKNSNVDV